MIEVVGVRFKKAGKIYYFDPSNIEINKGEYVIVETIRGIEFGEAVIAKKQINESEIVAPLKNVIRKATEEDIKKHHENKEKEKYALETCLQKIQEHKLNMKLIDVEYTLIITKLYSILQQMVEWILEN